MLYSPRKLLGVPDGGLLVHMSGCIEPASHSKGSDERRTCPRVMRRDDIEERDNARWFAAYQKVEAQMTVSREPMSALARKLLGCVDPQAIIRRRKENFDVLATLLHDVALIEGAATSFAPFGFPVRVPGRDVIWRALVERRIFAARNWPLLPSDPARFPAEHALSHEILLLPCDQRYDADDMRTVADAFRGVRA